MIKAELKSLKATRGGVRLMHSRLRIEVDASTRLPNFGVEFTPDANPVRHDKFYTKSIEYRLKNISHLCRIQLCTTSKGNKGAGINNRKSQLCSPVFSSNNPPKPALTKHKDAHLMQRIDLFPLARH